MNLNLCEKYKLGEKLGAEAFEKVFIGKDNTTGEDVAVKIETIEQDIGSCCIKIDKGK